MSAEVADALRRAAEGIRAFADAVPNHGVMNVAYEDGRFAAYEHAANHLLEAARTEADV